MLSPSKALMKRHEKAIELVPRVQQQDRILLLGFVVGLLRSPELERLEAERDGEQRATTRSRVTA